MSARKFRDERVVPPAAPYRFWMTPALAPLQAKHDAGEPLSKEEIVEYTRLRGKEDLFFFGRRCFGFDWLEAPLHSDLAYAWQVKSGTNHSGKIYGNVRMALLARGSLKTTLLTQAYAAWRLVNDQEERGLIFSYSYAFAVKILSVIKSRFEGHGPHGKWFLALYGDIIPAKAEREKWTENMLTVRRQGSYTDASLEASGVGAGVTGGHFTFACLDDPQGKPEIASQIQKIRESVDNLTPMLLKGAPLRIAATHWGFNDVITHLRRAHPNALIAQRAWKEDGNLVFSRTDEEAALSLKRRNPYLFSAWYENAPRDDTKDGFRRSWFKGYDQVGDTITELDEDGRAGRSLKATDCNVFFFIDPNTGRAAGGANAVATGRATDYLGVVVLLVGPDNSWYVARVVRARWSVERFVDEIFTLADYFQPKFIALEQRAAQILFRHIFLTEFKRRNRFFNLIDWKGGSASKEERIKGLMPRYANGMIFHRANGNASIQEGIQALEEELLDFPTAEYDDVSDALSAAGPLAYAPGHTPRVQIMAQHQKDASRLKLDRLSQRAWRVMDHEKQGSKSEFWH